MSDEKGNERGTLSRRAFTGLGVAAGAGLGATAAIALAGAFDAVASASGTPVAVPLAAFAGALAAVGLTYALGASSCSGSTWAMPSMSPVSRKGGCALRRRSSPAPFPRCRAVAVVCPRLGDARTTPPRERPQPVR